MKIKSILAILLLMVAGLHTAWAQKVVLNFLNKQVIEYNVSELENITFVEGETGDNHEWVDLGLPSGTLWATCNVGANSPEEYGDYFAWGETEPKEYYTWETYKYCKGSENTLTKYCWQSYDGYDGFTDNKLELDPEDDAATAIWGSKWQMPSKEQMEELMYGDYVQRTWTIHNGVNGMLFTSYNNGKSIFLPAGGFRGDPNLDPDFHLGTYGDYWSRSIDINASYEPYYRYFNSNYYFNQAHERYYGRSVRPVRVQDTINTTFVTGITLSEVSLTLTTGTTHILTATIQPSNATNKNVTWSSSNTSIAIVDQTGKVMAVAAGECTITCTATDGSGVKGTCKVIVKQVINGHEYVEIGGVKWATMNVGATTTAESYETCSGDFYAWGESETRYATITWTTSGASFTWKSGYNSGYSDDNYPTYDSATLDATHDAATITWGENWRTPTREDFVALAEACSGNGNEQVPVKLNNTITEGGIYWLDETQTYESEYTGVAGILFVSASDITKRVFFPACGYVRGTTLSYGSTYALYMSSLRHTSNTNCSYDLYFDSSRVDPSDYSFRHWGFTVRPVFKVIVTQIVLSESSLSLAEGSSRTLTATVFPDNADNKNVTWTSSNESIATVDQTGKVTAIAEGSCTITCSATDGSGVKAECQVTVTKAGDTALLTCPDDNHPHAIDLGLPSGTKWACCNVGASAPEGYGGYYAWGEICEKSVYNWSTYAYWHDIDGDGAFDSGECTNIGTNIVGTGYDAATVNMGALWRMPSLAQQQELINNCSRQWTTRNGVNGILVTGRNGGQIFLPAAGCREGVGRSGVGGNGYYWSGSLYSNDGYANNAFNLNFGLNFWVWYLMYPRASGCSVRAVCP